jgi:hypothetical protein
LFGGDLELVAGCLVDLHLIAARELLMRNARFFAVGSFCKRTFDLLPMK